jgi:hypothetical protein
MRLLLAALAAAAALVAAELATGGLDYGGQHVRDPCKPRPALTGKGIDPAAQRFVLKGLDATACQLGMSREQLVLDLARRGLDVSAIAASLERGVGGALDWIAEALRKVGG